MDSREALGVRLPAKQDLVSFHFAPLHADHMIHIFAGLEIRIRIVEVQVLSTLLQSFTSMVGISSRWFDALWNNLTKVNALVIAPAPCHPHRF